MWHLCPFYFNIGRFWNSWSLSCHSERRFDLSDLFSVTLRGDWAPNLGSRSIFLFPNVLCLAPCSGGGPARTLSQVTRWWAGWARLCLEVQQVPGRAAPATGYKQTARLCRKYFINRHKSGMFCKISKHMLIVHHLQRIPRDLYELESFVLYVTWLGPAREMTPGSHWGINGHDNCEDATPTWPGYGF